MPSMIKYQNTSSNIQNLLKPRLQDKDSLIKIFSHLDPKKIIRGLKACHRKILQSKKGILLIPYDITPMDLITHLPCLCEKHGIKYIFIESKFINELAQAKTICVFIKKKKEYLNEYNKIKSDAI